RASATQNQFTASPSAASPGNGERRARQVSQRGSSTRGPKADAEVLPQLRQARSGPLGMRNTSVGRRPCRYRGLAEDPCTRHSPPRAQFLSLAVSMGDALEVRERKPSHTGSDIAQAKQNAARAPAGRSARSPRRTWRALQNDGSSLLLPGIEGLRAARGAMGRLRLAGSDSTGSAQRGAGRSESHQDRGFTESHAARPGVGRVLAASAVPNVLPRGDGLCLRRRQREATMAGDHADRPHQTCGRSRWNRQDRMAHLSSHVLDTTARTGCPACCPKGAVTPLGHPDHYEYLHSGSKCHEEASGGEGTKHFARKEGCVAVLGTNGYSQVELRPLSP